LSKSILLVAAIIPLLLLAISNSNVVLAQSFLTYSNSDAGFKIQYPSNWKKIEPARVSQLETTNVIVYFVAPKQANKTSGVVIHTED
jgi:hypothetical protein